MPSRVSQDSFREWSRDFRFWDGMSRVMHPYVYDDLCLFLILHLGRALMKGTIDRDIFSQPARRQDDPGCLGAHWRNRRGRVSRQFWGRWCTGWATSCCDPVLGQLFRQCWEGLCPVWRQGLYIFIGQSLYMRVQDDISGVMHLVVWWIN